VSLTLYQNGWIFFFLRGEGNSVGKNVQEMMMRKSLLLMIKIHDGSIFTTISISYSQIFVNLFTFLRILHISFYIKG